MSEFDDMLSYFTDWQVSVTPVSITQAPNSTGEWVDTETELPNVDGLLYTKSAAERYYNLTLSEAVTDAFITHSTVFAPGMKIEYSGETYNVETVQNLARQDSLYVIGLRIRR